jgi:hypothetical protein
VKNRFQSLPFKCNLQRYIGEACLSEHSINDFVYEVGLYKLLNPVDTPISFKAPGFNPCIPEM